MTPRTGALLVMASLATAGCTVLPTTGLETAGPAPARWASKEAQGSAAEPANDWWRAIDDPVLQALVVEAGDIASVRIAQSRLDEARAALRGASAELAPRITGSASASASRAGDDSPRQWVRSAGVEATWDFDISGSNRARQAAALATVDARGEGVSASRITARAAAVRLYAAYATASEQRTLALATVRALDDALALARARLRAGLASDLDVAQAETALASARALIPRYDSARASARLGLEALLGRMPGELAATLEGVERIPAIDPALALRTPMAVMAARPDLRAAERELAAASASTAAAVRDRWPKLALDAVISEQALRIPGVLGTDGLARSLLFGVTGPLFDAGRLEAQSDVARARERIAATRYRQAVSDALGEVETGVVQFMRSGEQVSLNDQAVEAAQRQVAFARSRWRSGLSSFLNVVLAEQALYAAQGEGAAAKGRSLEAFAGLSAAMGLGL